MVNTPHTQWTGDDLHGHSKVIKPVWVLLEVLSLRPTDAPRTTVPDGLDMSGRTPGRLTGWFRSVNGDWLGIVDYEVPYADGRRNHLALKDQLVPVYALAERQ